MTNNEYEKLSVEAATGREQIRLLDKEITATAARLDSLMEHRRELINRYNLNKCQHDWQYDKEYHRHRCSKCGETKAMSFTDIDEAIKEAIRRRYDGIGDDQKRHQMVVQCAGGTMRVIRDDNQARNGIMWTTRGFKK